VAAGSICCSAPPPVSGLVFAVWRPGLLPPPRVCVCVCVCVSVCLHAWRKARASVLLGVFPGLFLIALIDVFMHFCVSLFPGSCFVERSGVHFKLSGIQMNECISRDRLAPSATHQRVCVCVCVCVRACVCVCV